MYDVSPRIFPIDMLEEGYSLADMYLLMIAFSRVEDGRPLDFYHYWFAVA